MQAKYTAFSAWLTPPAKSPYLLADVKRTRPASLWGFFANPRKVTDDMQKQIIRYTAFAALLLTAVAAIIAPAADTLPSGPVGQEGKSPMAWHTDYHAALDEAADRSRMTLVWFYNPIDPSANDRFEREILSQTPITTRINDHFTPLRLPLVAKVQSGGKEITLLDHPAFAELRHSPGLAIIDMTDADGPFQRQVVSIYPFNRGSISADRLGVLLALPRGSLTQRTLIFAVRTHPEFPASTNGHFSHLLSRETEKHAQHQASITLQGHHNWETRFHAINAALPGSLLAKEVCAESWPGQPLVEAAEECVHSWRQSSGHWDAVRSPHLLFGYDMKRGGNGVWYAAGIFAGR